MSNLYQHNLFMSVNVVPHPGEPPITVDVNLPLSMYYPSALDQNVFSLHECSDGFSDFEDRGITSPYDDDGS